MRGNTKAMCHLMLGIVALAANRILRLMTWAITEKTKTLKHTNQHCRGVPKNSVRYTWAVAYRCINDLLSLTSSEINRATKADAAAEDFARGSPVQPLPSPQ